MQKLDFTTLDSPVGLRNRLKAHSAGTHITGLAVLVVWLLISLPMLMRPSPSWIVIVVVGILALAAVASIYSRASQIMRLRRFADANQLTFRSGVAYDGRPGLIFGRGDSRKFTDLLTFSGEEFLEIGNYRYMTGSGKNRSAHYYNFVQIKLPRRLPHMLLDARKNNFLDSRFSNLPVGFSKDQRISLEGDFDKYFTLYAPAEYKTDALYVFTPDVMQKLIDSVRSYDIEIIDDNCYIFTTGHLAMHDRAKLEEILTITAGFRSELVDQADYYADERIDDRTQNIIAQPGARLKTGMSTAVKLLIGIFALSWIWIFIGPAVLRMI